ncbi:MAG TPA: DUF6265 family protein [Polyangiaceae bacterium]|nr:DUF6265 family protein [Polyangiaceae bacterium]
MLSLHARLTLFLLATLHPSCAPAAAAAETPPAAAAISARPIADASRLAWLQGRWVGSSDGMDMEEHWTSSAGGALIGMHKDVRGARMTSFEFLRIESAPEGGLVYFASPRSAAATPFALVELGDRRAVFENKAHDFPQRILYWLDAEEALHAKVEGTLRGSLRSEEWAWKKQR